MKHLIPFLYKITKLQLKNYLVIKYRSLSEEPLDSRAVGTHL